jgi:hypothetical protein
MEGASQIVQETYYYHWSGKVSQRQQSMDGNTMQVAYGFDLAGNLISVTPTGSGSSPWSYTFDVNPQFHPSGADTDNFNRFAVIDNGTLANIVTKEGSFIGPPQDVKYGTYASPPGKVSFTYDKYLRLLTAISGESTPAMNLTFTRDFLGEILSRVEPAYMTYSPLINNQYVYDGMKRLVGGEGDTEAYDELSNLITRVNGIAYTYQDFTEPNQDQMRLNTFNDGTHLYQYSYDANGNPMSVSKGAGWRFNSLSFDNLNMLRQIIYTQTDNYWYNVSGKRVKKTENATGAYQTLYTMFEGENPLMQEIYTASGRIQTIFNIIVDGQILAQYKMVYPSKIGRASCRERV